MSAFRSVQQGNQGVEFDQGTLVAPDPTSDRKSSRMSKGCGILNDHLHPLSSLRAKHLMTAYLRHVACATTQTKEAMEMPKVSRDSAPQRQEAGPVVDLRGELDGYTVSFTSVLEDIDATPLMKGLPDDRCPCPHWGYVLKGRMTARYADRDEVFEAGDAFYTPPGHIPVQHEPGTEFVWFSPSEELRAAEAVMLKNMQAMQDGSTP
jgi:hypothetical protein